MISFNNTKKNSTPKDRNSLTLHHPNILNSPNFPELEFRQTKTSMNRSFVEESREKQKISTFTLGEAFNPAFNNINNNNSQSSLRIDDLKVKKNHSLRYRDESLKISMKEKLLKQKIEEVDAQRATFCSE